MRTDGSAYSVYVATEELMTNVEVVERLKKNNEAEHAAIDLYQATFFRSVSPRPCGRGSNMLVLMQVDSCGT